MARQKREIEEVQPVSGDSPLELDSNDDDGQSSYSSSALPSAYDPLPTPTDCNHTHNHTHNTSAFTLPPISQHHASIASLDLSPLLSSSAHVQLTNKAHQRQPHRHKGQLAMKMHQSGGNPSTSRRYSPASSPSHPLVLSRSECCRLSVQSELAQIEYCRNMRRLALLAEQVQTIIVHIH